uniref:Myelin basic protein n=1 Tax=Callithrix jacchus TaxID=9483 RepID=A0A2R8MH73_CALJA
MGNHAGKRELNSEKTNTNGETNRGESEKKRKLGELSQTNSEDNEVFGEADANQNNGTPSQDTAVTDSKRTADPKNAWQDARSADPGSRPHLIRLFSRDAPGREDNTFKDRPSESDELQSIQEDGAATSESLDVMASQKRPSQRHGSKYLATASTTDHARHGFLPRHRDTGILDSIGRFFGGDRGVPKRGSGKDSHHAVRTAHYGSLPQKSHGRTQGENPVVHFFKNIVTPRTPPPSQGKGRGLSLSRFSWILNYVCGSHVREPRERATRASTQATALLSLRLTPWGPKGRDQDLATEAERPTINRLTRDSRESMPRARFPKFLSWEEEIVALDHPWLDAENPPGSRLLPSAS